MNNIYKVIWSKAKNCYVVASEIARSHTKSASGSTEKIGGVTRKALLALGTACAIVCGGFVNVGATVHVDASTSSTANEVYTKGEVDNKFDTVNKDINNNANNIKSLNDNVGDSTKGLIKDVADNSTAIGKLEGIVGDASNGLVKDVDNLEKAVGDAGSGLTKSVADNATAIGKLETVVGDNSNGLIKNVNDVSAKVGTLETTVAGKANQSDVDNLTNIVGNNSTGLVKDVNDLKETVGDSTKGLVKGVADNKTDIGKLNEKTSQISFDNGSNSTKINGMDVGANQVDMASKNLTNVGTINGTTIGDKVTSGTYVKQDKSLWGNLGELDTQTKNNTDKINDLDGSSVKYDDNTKDKISLKGTDGTTITNLKDATLSDTSKDAVTGKQLNATNTKLTEEANTRESEDTKLSNRIGAVAKNGKYIQASNDTNTIAKNLEYLDTALASTDQRTSKITRDDTKNETTIEGKVTIDNNGNVKTEGTITGAGVDAGNGEIKTTGKVSAGDVSTGTLETTGKATIGGNLEVKGKLNVGKIEMSHVENDTAAGKSYNNSTTIDADGIISSKEVKDRDGSKIESNFTNNADGTNHWVKKTESDGSWTKASSNVTLDETTGKPTIKNTVEDSQNNKNESIDTATDSKRKLTDTDGNTNEWSQNAKETSNIIKDKDGKEKASTKMDADGNITHTGTNSVTNKVGENEVKVSTSGVDIKTDESGTIKESVGDNVNREMNKDHIKDSIGTSTSREMTDGVITDTAGGHTVTTNNNGTTFGNGTADDITVINGGTIGTNVVNANETNTKKLTAGADADANGGRLTVDATDGVKGSYKSGDYTSKSYILKNTLKSGVDNGTGTDDNYTIGSRTDHSITDDGQAKLDETVKDANGSNVTNKTSTSSKSTIENTDTVTTIEQTDGQIQTSVSKKDGTASNVSTNYANASANQVTEDGQWSKVTNNKNGLMIQNSDNQTGFTTADGTSTGTAQGWTNIKGNEISTGKVEANYAKMNYADVMKDLGVKGKTTTGSLEVTGTSKLTGDVTMESNATVKKDLNVEGTTTTKDLHVTNDATVDGTLTVKKGATFQDSVDIAKDLTVGGNATITGDVTANSFTAENSVLDGTHLAVNGKTYIDSAGLNANNQVIRNVADGSISEGSKDAVNGGQLYQVKNDLEGKVNKVGANAAAMANLHPMEFDPDSKWNIAAAMGNYGSETATAMGLFYRPNEDVMVNLSTAFGTGENMVGGGVSVRLGKGGNKATRQENSELKAKVDDLTARMDALLSVLNPNMSKDFPDVPENHWAYEAVSRLAGNDIIQGYPDGEFHGDRTMTRYEMAEIIYNALSRGASAEKKLVEEFKPELQALAASNKATADAPAEN